MELEICFPITKNHCSGFFFEGQNQPWSSEMLFSYLKNAVQTHPSQEHLIKKWYIASSLNLHPTVYKMPTYRCILREVQKGRKIACKIYILRKRYTLERTSWEAFQHIAQVFTWLFFPDMETSWNGFKDGKMSNRFKVTLIYIIILVENIYVQTEVTSSWVNVLQKTCIPESFCFLERPEIINQFHHQHKRNIMWVLFKRIMEDFIWPGLKIGLT